MCCSGGDGYDEAGHSRSCRAAQHRAPLGVLEASELLSSPGRQPPVVRELVFVIEYDLGVVLPPSGIRGGSSSGSSSSRSHRQASPRRVFAFMENCQVLTSTSTRTCTRTMVLVRVLVRIRTCTRVVRTILSTIDMVVLVRTKVHVYVVRTNGTLVSTCTVQYDNVRPGRLARTRVLACLGVEENTDVQVAIQVPW